MAADTSVSLSQWQSGCQGVIFQYPLGSAQMSYLTHITDALSMGTTGELCGFNHPLWSLSVLGCARTRPDYDVSSQDGFYSSSVKVVKNLALYVCFWKVFVISSKIVFDVFVPISDCRFDEIDVGLRNNI